MLWILAFLFSIASASPPFAIGGEADAPEYWKRPVSVGASMPVEGLYPEKCAKCHSSQYDDWKGALHSKSAGAGLVAQIDPKSGPQTAVSCYFCHAPLAVQNEVIAGGDANAYIPNGFFDEKMKLSGVSCAVCHVREGGVFGPASHNPGGTETGVKAEHASSQKDFFGKAEFCAACHQLDEGFDLNGKLLVNTYREWKESGYGKSGITCQNCHMPGRRHLFRGIHDPEMVKNGVKFEVERTANGARAGVKLRITNTGVGHYFPTYATPLVAVKGYLTDAKGKALRGTLKEAAIGRKVNLALSKEIFDTRIAPHKSYEFDYTVKKADKAVMLVFEVVVFPDEFYNRFFANAIKNNDSAMKKAELKEAFENTSVSGYLLFRKEIMLKDSR